MNHFEGGWPKDINPQENDQTMRFRKKIEKDDNYINTVLGLCTVMTRPFVCLPFILQDYTLFFIYINLKNLFQSMEQCIRQNNAIDIYEDYFEVQDDSTQCERPEAKTVHVFRDPTPTHYKRPISSISWCPDGGSKIAIAYCNLEFQATHPDATKESYVFKVGKILYY